MSNVSVERRSGDVSGQPKGSNGGRRKRQMRVVENKTLTKYVKR
jgi:hypothetical protein